MNLQGPPVKQITAEILQNEKNLCKIYMENLLVTIVLLHPSLKHLKILFVPPLQEQDLTL